MANVYALVDIGNIVTTVVILQEWTKQSTCFTSTLFYFVIMRIYQFTAEEQRVIEELSVIVFIITLILSVIFLAILIIIDKQYASMLLTNV